MSEFEPFLPCFRADFFPDYGTSFLLEFSEFCQVRGDMLALMLDDVFMLLLESVWCLNCTSCS